MPVVCDQGLETTERFLAKFTQNIYFGLTSGCEKLFGKVLKTNPYFEKNNNQFNF